MFTYSPLEKKNAIEDYGKKQIKAVENRVKEKTLKQR